MFHFFLPRILFRKFKNQRDEDQVHKLINSLKLSLSFCGIYFLVCNALDQLVCLLFFSLLILSEQSGLVRSDVNIGIV